MASVQPASMKSFNGVLVTIGIVCNEDRQAIVLPMVLEGAIENPVVLCADANTAIDTDVFPLLVPMMTGDSFISFISSEGMDDGKVPARVDWDASVHPGTGTVPAGPSQVASLLSFYADPADILPGDRMSMGKNFIPAIAGDQYLGDELSGAYQTLATALAQKLLTGVDSPNFSGKKWWRVVAAPKPRAVGVPVTRSVTGTVRGYVVTQKRRLQPR